MEFEDSKILDFDFEILLKEMAVKYIISVIRVQMSQFLGNCCSKVNTER